MLFQILNIYPSEKKSFLLFILLGFLWSFGGSCGFITADGLFLEYLGSAHLPKAFISTAIVLLLFSFLFIYLFNFWESKKIFISFICIAITFYTILPLCIHYNCLPNSIWFIYKVTAYILYILLTSCFWTFIDQYFGLQIAKRLYSIFYSSIFTGTGLAGALISCCITKLPLSYLFVCIIGALILSLICIKIISSSIEPITDESTASHSLPIKQSKTTFIKAILSSKFTLAFLIVNVLIHTLVVVTEFSYMDVLEKIFNSSNGSNNQLTAFIGQLNIWVSLGNIFFGILLYSRVVTRFGLNNIVLIVPACFVSIFTGWHFGSGLIFAIMGFILTEGVLTTIDDNNFNLLLNAVPTKLKHAIRAATECLLEPIGMLISAILLLIFQAHSKTLGLVLSSFLLLATLFMRSYYSSGILKNLLDHAINFDNSLSNWLKGQSRKKQQTSRYTLLSNLKKTDSLSQISALKSLLELKDPQILKFIIRYLNQLPIPIRQQAIDQLDGTCFANHPHIIQLLIRWKETYPSLTGCITFYLAKQGLFHPEDGMKLLENEKNLDSYSAGILSLLLAETYTPSIFNLTYYREIAIRSLLSLLQSNESTKVAYAFKVISQEKKPQHIELVFPYLKHPNEIIRHNALETISNLIDDNTHHIALIILNYLKRPLHSQTRITCLKGMQNLNSENFVISLIKTSAHFRPNERRYIEKILTQKKDAIIPLLLQLLKDPAYPDKSRILCGRTLASLSLKLLRQNISIIIHREIDLAYFYFYHSKTIQKRYPDFDLKMLESALYSGFSSVIDFIIQMLALSGSIEDCEHISQSLKSSNIKIHNQAIETMEKTCDTKVFRRLKPLIDEFPENKVLAIAEKTLKNETSLKELLDFLEATPCSTNQIVSATLKAKFQFPDWKHDLLLQMQTQENLFHSFATELLNTC